MGEDQKQCSICKICKKTFANWRILGGHMRGHVTKKTEDPNFGNKGFDYFHDCEDSSYGLRENPKKTWRVSVPDLEQSNDDGENRLIVRCSKRVKEEHKCKQCGKGFRSMRALFGHMRHHSAKQSRVSIQSEKFQPGLEILCPIKKKRSKLRYKVSEFCTVSDFNLVSKFSEFNGEEEAALGLIMLSSGFTQWADFVSDFDSSENDSLILRAKALNRNKMKLGVSEIGDIAIKISGQKTGKSELFEAELGYKNGFDFEPVQAGSKIESGETIFGVQDTKLEMRFNANDYELGEFDSGNEFKKPAIGDDFEINISDSEIENGNNLITSEETIFGNKIGSAGVEIYDSVFKISETCGHKFELKRKICNNCNHECPICFKVFPSGQALGGHKRAHFNDKNKDVEMLATHFSFEKQIDSGFGLKPFWANTDCGVGPVVISNC